jgi:hypothetical protein
MSLRERGAKSRALAAARAKKQALKKKLCSLASPTGDQPSMIRLSSVLDTEVKTAV